MNTEQVNDVERRITPKADEYRAKYQYNPQTHYELRLEAGDSLSDVVIVENGWAVAANKTTGERVICPVQYLKKKPHGSVVGKVTDRVSSRVSSIFLSARHSIFQSKSDNCVSLHPVESSADEKPKGMVAPREKTTICAILLRFISGIITGLVLGGLIFTALFYVYQFSLIYAAAISGGITLIMSLLIVISPFARCVAALMSVSVFTNQGRLVILSLIPGLIITGPVLNIRTNVVRITDSLSCMPEIVSNYSTEWRNRILEESELKRQDMVTAGEDLETNLSVVRKNVTSTATKPSISRSEIFREKCVQRLSKLKDNCESRARKASSVCQSVRRPRVRRHLLVNLTTTEDPCSQVCSEIDSGQLCIFLNDTERLCQPESRPKRSLASSLDRLHDLLKVRINTTNVADVNNNASFPPIEKLKNIKENMDQAFNKITYILSIVNKILIIFLFLAFIHAGLYVRRYIKDIKHDNIYITRAMKDLFKETKCENPTKTFLPLNKHEKKKYIDSTSFRLRPAEVSACKFGVTKLIFHIIIATLFILFDYALFFVVRLFQEAQNISFMFNAAMLKVDVEGFGPVADFVRTVLNVTLSQSPPRSLSFDECLPIAAEPSQRRVALIYSLYFLVFVFILFQAFALRLRRKLMAWFYPQREAERVQYLYQQMVKKRKLRDQNTMENKLPKII